ncbi:hypothetical protein PCANC_01738 [Puccinia coronata f. sp. avenae]|uniref:LYR motif-containing protein 2 n=1 Tax=Puccinia coronata f. sp. avenae TaxID=200324 RepID=A0A2N5W3E1_9BASI|nr:hypothetical protein PCANC_15712 [Puccinia coronata f. sp. avenae]PLW24289.1 hypothetical protein PCASD_09280 [Puccinia coronata f. sp. avenae]PLW52201.1 hypothetical protein PCASD_00166 [Puccinia coronata f. sp. avenae]PLW56764.1 hypothetical protein PCANC_01738 [Puccinia coronata f. sp. avenae]
MIAHSIQLQRTRIPADGLGLAHFVFQAKIRSLYRNILRETRYLGTNEVRRETISWIRHEFVKKPINGKMDESNNQDFLAQMNRQLKQIKNSSMLIGGGFEKLRGS